jgi:hypothetical protein
MTAKDRAVEIAMRFDKEGETDNAIKCALICVDRNIESLRRVGHSFCNDEIEHLKEVKQEIKKL